MKIVVLAFDLLVVVYAICSIVKSCKDEWHRGGVTNILALLIAVGATALIFINLTK